MIPEKDAADRIAAVVGEHLSPRWISDEGLQAIAAKVVAHRGFCRSVFDSLDANPRRIGERDVVLQQQATAQLDSVEWWEEHAGHLRREADDAAAILERVRAAQSPQLVDRDDARAQEDTDRLNAERAAERAANQAPRVAS